MATKRKQGQKSERPCLYVYVLKIICALKPKKRNRASVGERQQTQQGQAVVDLMNTDIEVNEQAQPKKCVNRQQDQLINQYATFINV